MFRWCEVFVLMSLVIVIIWCEDVTFFFFSNIIYRLSQYERKTTSIRFLYKKVWKIRMWDVLLLLFLFPIHFRVWDAFSFISLSPILMIRLLGFPFFIRLIPLYYCSSIITKQSFFIPQIVNMKSSWLRWIQTCLNGNKKILIRFCPDISDCWLCLNYCFRSRVISWFSICPH